MKDEAIETYSFSKLTLQFDKLFFFLLSGSWANANVELMTEQDQLTGAGV